MADFIAFSYLFEGAGGQPRIFDALSLRNLDAARLAPEDYADCGVVSEKQLAVELAYARQILCLSLPRRQIRERLDQLRRLTPASIAFGYAFEISFPNLRDLAAAPELYAPEPLFDRLSREFAGESDSSPRFLGPIDLAALAGLPSAGTKFKNPLMSAYLRFALREEVPLVFDARKMSLEEISRFCTELAESFPAELPALQAVIAFLGHELRVETRVEYEGEARVTRRSFPELTALKDLLCRGFCLGVDLRAFLDLQDVLAFLRILGAEACAQLLLSPSTRFKTDLEEFGGGSGRLHRECCAASATEQSLQTVFLRNPARLFRQRRARPAPVAVVARLHCAGCGNDFATHAGKVAKDGLDFCGLECFRLHLNSARRAG